MTAVTFPNGNSYSDDGTTANDMRNGGFRTSLLPMISDTIGVSNSAVAAAASAGPAATAATTAATTATTQAAIATAAANTAVGVSLIKQPSEIAGIDPAIDAYMASSLALPAGVVQSASAKLVTDRAGLLTSVASLTAPVDFDPVTAALRGLLVEESRTNLVYPSADFTAWSTFGGTITVTGDTTASPAGTVTADTISDGDSANTPFCYKNVTIANDSATYTYSVFLKPGTSTASIVRLSFQGGTSVNRDCVINWSSFTATASGGATAARLDALANGWYRASVTGANNGTGNTTAQLQIQAATASASATGSVIAWGAQFEVGAFPTSDIPTVGSTVTRAADANTLALASVPGWNASEGTIYVEARTALASGTQTYAQYDDGTANNRLCVYRDSSNVLRCIVVVSGSTVVNLNLGTVANDTAFKVAFSWKANSFAASVNGGAAVTSSSGAIPSGLTTHRIGHDSSGNHANGPIRRDVGFPRAVTSATTTLLTA